MQAQQVQVAIHALSMGRLALLPFEIRQHIFYSILQNSVLEDTSKASWRFSPFSDTWKRSAAPLVEDLDLAIIASTAGPFLPSIFELKSHHVENW